MPLLRKLKENARCLTMHEEYVSEQLGKLLKQIYVPKAIRRTIVLAIPLSAPEFQSFTSQ